MLRYPLVRSVCRTLTIAYRVLCAQLPQHKRTPFVARRLLHAKVGHVNVVARRAAERPLRVVPQSGPSEPFRRGPRRTSAAPSRRVVPRRASLPPPRSCCSATRRFRRKRGVSMAYRSLAWAKVRFISGFLRRGAAAKTRTAARKSGKTETGKRLAHNRDRECRRSDCRELPPHVYRLRMLRTDT
jgi:hypothetical protein